MIRKFRDFVYDLDLYSKDAHLHLIDEKWRVLTLISDCWVWRFSSSTASQVFAEQLS